MSSGSISFRTRFGKSIDGEMECSKVAGWSGFTEYFELNVCGTSCYL